MLIGTYEEQWPTLLWNSRLGTALPGCLPKCQESVDLDEFMEITKQNLCWQEEYIVWIAMEMREELQGLREDQKTSVEAGTHFSMMREENGNQSDGKDRKEQRHK